MDPKANIVISISRQLGSGGSYIGQQLAKRLNCFYADREIIRKAAESLSILEEDLESRDERIVSVWQSFIESFMFIPPNVYIPPKVLPPTDRELFKFESEVIQRIAKEDSAIIIGRCGSYLLKGLPNHISVFLHADVGFRVKRIQELYNVSEEAANKMIAQSDKERARYNQTFTGQEWTDARQYCFSFDSSKIGLDRIVELILNQVEFMQA